jgi:hypothetical protein
MISYTEKVWGVIVEIIVELWDMAVKSGVSATGSRKQKTNGWLAREKKPGGESCRVFLQMRLKMLWYRAQIGFWPLAVGENNMKDHKGH